MTEPTGMNPLQMPSSVRDFWWAPLVPLLLVMLAVGTFVGMRSYVECTATWADCRKPNVAALVVTDRSIQFDATGALVAAMPALPDSVRANVLRAAADRHSARLVWVSFVGLNIIATLAAIGVAALLLRPAKGERPRRLVRRAAVVFGLSAVVGLFLLARPKKHMNLMFDVLERSAGLDPALGAVGNAEHIMNRVNSFEQAAAVALVLAACLLLLPPRAVEGAPTNDPEVIFERSVRPTLHRLRNLHLFLYTATILLIVGVLRMQVTGAWVLTFVRPEDAKALSTLFMTLSWVMGAFFSLMLAAIYLPSAYILRLRLAAILDALGTGGDPKRVAVDAFHQPLGETLSRIAALLGPLLAGPIGQLFNSFTS